ncbi:MAG TPA: glycosyltransferase family 4 protein [Candidatus Udaeobacter sp.]|nr:glycosyltransferase family 4 protein [Candidatus Udaeobacter sp.]
MRLAFYAPMKPPGHPTPSGDRRMARLLVRALEEAGHEVELASEFRSREPAGNPARQSAIAHEAGREAARLIAAYAALPPAGRPKAWFTYHVYYKAPDWIGPRVAAALSIPYFLAEASLAPKRAGGPWAIGHEATLAAIDAADRLFVINPADRPCLLEAASDPARLVDLPAFLDTGPYSQAATGRAAHRRQLGERHAIAAGPPWLLAVAMMRPGDKLASYRIMGQSLMILRKRDWHLLVVGDGPAASDVRAALAPLGAERVSYLGYVSEAELPAHYAAADLLFWPAVNEAYGMALLEAQAAGLPVVAGASGGVPAIVDQGVTGLLAPPGDPRGFAEALAALIDQPARRAAMSAAALDRTKRRHHIAGASRILGEVLDSVVGAPSKAQRRTVAG